MKIASVDGLGGISIGTLASSLGLSKSGLFAHFNSKENLQIQTLAAASQTFIHQVVRPALKEARGEPRVRALLANWLDWDLGKSLPGGCIFIAAASELDDQPGPVRDALVRSQLDWTQTLARAVRIAIEEGHFRADLDADRFAFEMFGLLMSGHHYTRLLEDPRGHAFVLASFERLVDDAKRPADSR